MISLFKSPTQRAKYLAKNMMRSTGQSFEICTKAVVEGLRWCNKGKHWESKANFRMTTSERSRICDTCREKPVMEHNWGE